MKTKEQLETKLHMVEAKIKAYNHWHDNHQEFFEAAKVMSWILMPTQETKEYSKILKSKI